MLVSKEVTVIWSPISVVFFSLQSHTNPLVWETKGKMPASWLTPHTAYKSMCATLAHEEKRRNEWGQESETCKPPCFLPALRKCICLFWFVSWMFFAPWDRSYAVCSSFCLLERFFSQVEVNINSEKKVLILFLTWTLGQISNLEGEGSAVFASPKIRCKKIKCLE